MGTVSWRADTENRKADRERSSRSSNDGPFTVSVVWVIVRIARAG